MKANPVASIRDQSSPEASTEPGRYYTELEFAAGPRKRTPRFGAQPTHS